MMAENMFERDEQTKLEKARSDVVTVVFTADNHLGYTEQQSRKREERRQWLHRAFQQATDFAVMQGVDLFIQAGDLFDTTMPDERDRSFVAERLANLKQAGVHTLALGGVHDTPLDDVTPAPQMSYARLGALQYFSPVPSDNLLEPRFFSIRGEQVGVCALGVLPDQNGDPLAQIRISDEIERATIPLLLLHAPIEGLASSSPLLASRTQISRAALTKLSAFRYILAGFHHGHCRFQLGQTEVIVAGATQHVDFSVPDATPGFLFMGLAADGIRWCNHIPVDTLKVKQLSIPVNELWPADPAKQDSLPTEAILSRLRPLCHSDTMIQLRLEGELTRSRYHDLDLNQIRRYGEEHCFALAIDDSALSLLPDQEAIVLESSERLSLHSEVSAIVDEWMNTASDEQEKQILQWTKEEVLSALEEMRR